jgi:glycosyltransferase involved in cell wall biosynthesis
MSTNKTIIIITSSFPFGSGEIFIKTELFYLQKVFKRIIIFASADENSEKSEMDIEAYKFELHKHQHLFSTFFSSEFWKEIWAYISSRSSKITVNGIKHLFLMYCGAFAKKNQISQFILRQNIQLNDDLYFYSYWMTDDAMALAMLKKKHHLKHTFTRAHGYDVYETRNEFNFLPGRKIIKDNLDTLFFISESGMQHFIHQHGAANKCVLARLGVIEQDYKKEESSNILHIVSCSYIHTVKRIELLMDTLLAVNKSINIHWTHIGGGSTQKFWDDAHNYSKQLLSNQNLQFKMLGSKSNDEILDYYKNSKVDVLINVSASEGIPVTIMEAMSFGIPVIALKVGGIPEIVKDGYNGFLANESATERDIAILIENFRKLNQAEIDQLRQNAYQTWKNKFNAEENYISFVQKLIN